ncbi:MAG: DNA repair protein RadC [Methylacidiphilaceae bacterium]|nr:DNA repair protein RadC [Candidatus Methylacidiphilaceae bacterium]
MATNGPNGLKDSELLAILLGSGRSGLSAVGLGEELITRFGGLQALGRASAAELAQCKGVGQTKAARLVAAFALGVRLAQEDLLGRRIASPKDAVEFLGPRMRLLPVEILLAVLLDAKGRVLAVEEITRGTLNESLYHPREAFRAAIARNAHSVLFAHNHPSGDPTPSAEDVAISRAMKQAGEILGIEVVDHLILGGPRKGKLLYHSLRERGEG